jgi:hypothetical protein
VIGKIGTSPSPNIFAITLAVSKLVNGFVPEKMYRKVQLKREYYTGKRQSLAK